MCAAAFPNSADSQGYAAEVRSRDKHRKYDGMCAAAGDELVTLVVETFGLFAGEFLAFLDELPQHARQPSMLHAGWRYSLLAAVSCAVQEGNFAIWRKYAALLPDNVVVAPAAPTPVAAASLPGRSTARVD